MKKAAIRPQADHGCQAAIAARLSDPALYQDKADEAVTLQKRTAQIEEELLAALTRWEELDARK